MADRTCAECGKEFAKPCYLKRHKERKTPCQPIVNPPNVNGINCRYCGRAFTTRQAASRHIRMYCKIANSEEGMEKLLDHTLQHQIAAQAAKTDALQAQVSELTMLLKNQLSMAPVPLQFYNASVTNNIFNINPWDGSQRIDIDIAHIVAAFTENAKLQEYSRLGDHELTSPDIAPPFVTELLVDLTKRAHSTPEARNIYLNPKRADQVLVHKKNGTWEVLPLTEATRLMFDGVAASIHRTVMTTAEMRQLPVEAQNALSMAGMLYDEEPDEYARRAKIPIMAHLENCRDAIESVH